MLTNLLAESKFPLNYAFIYQAKILKWKGVLKCLKWAFKHVCYVFSFHVFSL